jgi:tetratricopeptide (TPR) repeat protein
LAEYNLKLYDQAIADYTIALQKNSKDAPTFINRSTAYYEEKRYELAFKDYCSAGDLRYALNKEYFFKLKALAGK